MKVQEEGMDVEEEAVQSLNDCPIKLGPMSKMSPSNIEPTRHNRCASWTGFNEQNCLLRRS